MERRTILKARYVWDGLKSRVFDEGAVLIEKGMIRAVGPASELLSAPDARVIDWRGATLLPGLVDSHTHLSMDGSLEDYLDHMSDNIAVLTLRATAMMRKDLMAGVTTCRCLGDKEFLDVECRKAEEKGEVIAPRLLVATRGIRAAEGHGFVGYPFRGQDEIRKAIKENVSRGADLIKIYITGTLKGNGNLPAYLTREEVMLAIEESHDAGLRIASHCVGGPGLDWAIELGLDTIEHGYHITKEQVEKLADSASALVLTPGAVLSEKRVRRLPHALIEGHLRERDQMFNSMSLAIKSKTLFAVGTDGMHGDLAEDIAYLSTLGATNVEALQAATIHGASVCGLGNEIGSLQPGKRADIIAVAGNPLDDLGALRNVIAVIKKGNIEYQIPDKEKQPEVHAYGDE